MAPRKIPLSRPSIGAEEIQAVVEVLKSGWLAHGDFNHRFEEAFARLIGVPHAVSMNSCTSALEVCLRAAGIRGEVILPSFTFVASANAVVNAGATPVFCDVDGPTRNATAPLIQQRISPRTEAVMVVHFGGQPCPMDEITDLCERKHLLLIEDSAETLGATWRGRQAGSFGIGCFSFFPTKNITTGEGGMVTCREEPLARKIRMMVSHGIPQSTLTREKDPRPWLRSAEMAGHNFRMPNPLAALGVHQLLRLSELNRKRVALADRYTQALRMLSPWLKTPEIREGATHVYQMYTLQVPEEARDPLLTHLRARGIGASVHFDPPVHLHPFYRRSLRPGEELPVTERLARELITLPLYPDMTEEEQDWVLQDLRDFSQIARIIPPLCRS